MTSNLPQFLVTRVRLAFRQCAQQHRTASRRQLSVFQPTSLQASIPRRGRRARDVPATSSKAPQPKEAESNGSKSVTNAQANAASRFPEGQSQSTELVPQEPDRRAVGTGRTVDAPMKIIPKADITPNLRLTPKERLHIEILTRRGPPVVKQVKPYKERLLIYHHGNAVENASVFLKCLGLVCAGTVTMIVVPAHYAAGTPLWLCGVLFLGGIFPSFFFHYLLKPLVTRVHLRLPPKARVTPEAAMKYAKKLPSEAQIDVSFTRMTALPGTVTVSLAELEPINQKGRWPWQFANLRWTGPLANSGSWFRRNPTEFSVKPVVGAGKAKRDVIPGIWPDVYKRLTEPEMEPVSRWKRA